MDNRLQWWKDAKFGMFIHWGLYSSLGGEYKGQRMDYIGEWIMSRFEIPVKEYEKLASEFDIFAFDADKVVKLAKDAGMKYIIFTAKHHEGFCMYDSKVDDFNITKMSPNHRDPLRELADACKKNDIKLCLYYSQALDWHEQHAGGGKGPGNKGMCWGNNWDFPNFEEKDFSIYFKNKCMPQLKEILTNYGDIHILWFDCPATITREQCEEIYDTVKSLQPNCIMNSRLGQGLGDYRTLGDNLIPAAKLEGDWEAVTTLNDTWGYKYFDNNWKQSKDLIALLAGLASKNINYVINIGPDGNGKIPTESVMILEEVGQWLKVNGEAIYSVQTSPFDYDFDWGYITTKGNNMYFILSQINGDKVQVSGIKSNIKKITALCDENLKMEYIQEVNSDRQNLTISIPQELKGEIRPVLKIEIDGQIEVEKKLIQQANNDVCLPSTVCDIHNSEDEVKELTLNHAETDALAVVVNNKITIAPLGCTTNWTEISNYISWDFKTFEKSKFNIEILTSGLRHDNPWKGGHNVTLIIDGEEINVDITDDKHITSPNARYYTQAITFAGGIELDKGEHKLILKANKIESNDNVGLAVIDVSLRARSE